MHKIPSLRALAKRTGYSLATVSLAMRNDTCIKPGTRRLIQAAAREGGYRPNAGIAKAMSQIRLPGHSRRFDALAWLYLPYPSGYQPHHDYLHTLKLAATERAARLGWELQEFSLTDPAYPPHQTGRMLFSRGIRAAVIAPLHRRVQTLGIDYSRLAAVAVGYSLSEPDLCRVARQSVDSMSVLFHQLKRFGYTRPGFIQFKEEHLKTRKLPWAAFRIAQDDLPFYSRIPPLTLQSMKPIGEWFRRHRPDVVIADRADFISEIRKLSIRVPEDVGFVLMTRTREDTGIAGLDPNYKLHAESAVDLAIQMAQRGEYGIPRVQKVILIGGTWHDGKTLAFRKGNAM